MRLQPVQRTGLTRRGWWRVRFAMAVRRCGQLVTFRRPWRLVRSMARGDEDICFERREVTVIAPNVPAARGVVFELFCEDEYRLDELLFDSDRPAVVDIGAHIGCFALTVAVRFPGAVVDTFEASAATAGYLERNVALNGCGDRVRVHRTAVAGSVGSLELADAGVGSAHNGLLYLGHRATTAVVVPCIGLAEVISQAGGHVDLLKLDAEGAEHQIIGEASNETLAAIDRMVLEYHPVAGSSFETLRRRCERSGLAMTDQRVDGPELGLAWFSRRI